MPLAMHEIEPVDAEQLVVLQHKLIRDQTRLLCDEMLVLGVGGIEGLQVECSVILSLRIGGIPVAFKRPGIDDGLELCAQAVDTIKDSVEAAVSLIDRNRVAEDLRAESRRTRAACSLIELRGQIIDRVERSKLGNLVCLDRRATYITYKYRIHDGKQHICIPVISCRTSTDAELKKLSARISASSTDSSASLSESSKSDSSESSMTILRFRGGTTAGEGGTPAVAAALGAALGVDLTDDVEADAATASGAGP